MMTFNEFMQLSEAPAPPGPPGGGLGAPPMNGPPGGGMPPPGPGGPPGGAGGPPGGMMGGGGPMPPPPGGGMPGGGGEAAPVKQIKPVDVWSVLDEILKNKQPGQKPVNSVDSQPTK